MQPYQKPPVSPWMIGGGVCCGIPCGLLVLIMLIGMVANLSMTPEQRAAQAAKAEADAKRAFADGSQAPRANQHESAPANPISVSASSLYTAYDKNAIAADKQYTDRLVKVSGTVETIDRGIDQKPYITLKTNAMFMSVQCEFSPESEGALSSLSKGQQVSVVGTCRGKIMNVMVTDCSLK